MMPTWRIRRVTTSANGHSIAGFGSPEREFRYSLPRPGDDERVIGESSRGFGLAVPDPDPLPRASIPDHRSGTSFDNESEAMRAAAVPTLTEHLDADAVVHEARHQKKGYHTDLVFADVDADAVRERDRLTASRAPIHDPLQRFKTWWYLVENGPKPRSVAIEDGLYVDASKNRRHIDWLQTSGYVAETSTGHLQGVCPPKLAHLHAVELKLRDWETALEQAARANRCDVADMYYDTYRDAGFFDRFGYADYRWVALDATAIGNALAHRDRFEERGVGLLAVAEGGTVVEHVAADLEPRRRYTRDRAYIESQVWQQLDIDEWVDAATPDDGQSPAQDDQTAQRSLSTY